MSLLEFEKQYKNILETIEEWSYLRIQVGFFFKNKDRPSRVKLQRVFFSYIGRFKYLFYGFRHWFKHYDYLFFSDSSQRKEIDGIFYHRFFDTTADYVNNILLFERPNPIHYQNRPLNDVVSDTLLTLLTAVVYSVLFVLQRFKKNTMEVSDFLKQHVQIDIRKEILKFQARYIVYKILLSIYRPKKIFLTCYYCYLPLVKASKDLNIEVIEYQHGVISQSHFGYISYVDISSSYLPDILLSFGENEKKLQNMIIKHIVPVGSFYLDYLTQAFCPNIELQKIIEPYSTVVGISMQDAQWEREKVLSFLGKIADKNKDILYILIPRNQADFPNIASNVIVYNQLDCYQVILHCNIHMTLYSSCALEAPSLGIPNVLLDLDSIVKQYYRDLLDPYHTVYIKDYQALMREIVRLQALSKDSIIKKNQKVFKMGFKQNIANFIKVYIYEGRKR